MTQLNKLETSPQLPGILAIPFRLLPAKLHSKFLVIILNRIMSQQIKEGDIDFLQDRSLCIKIRDASIRYNINFTGRLLVSGDTQTKPDLTIQASTYDFLCLAARQEDPDTLKFQRRLVMEGDTELGLELKNFLDGLDIESSRSFSMIESLLQKSLPAYRKLFSKTP